MYTSNALLGLPISYLNRHTGFATQIMEFRMSSSVIILGANGSFGRASVNAFGKAGWRISALYRNTPNQPLPANCKAIIGDINNPDSLHSLPEQCDVIINAINPPYQHWSRDVPRITKNVIAVAKSRGATVMVPGNIYHYGTTMPEVLTETTPILPDTPLGQVRADLESAYQSASTEGLQTIILRAGDFLDTRQSGNWFDSHILKRLNKGRLMYPGPLDRKHAWAYLPDMASVMVRLAEKRNTIGSFTTLGFPGYALTGQELAEQVSRNISGDLAIDTMPWRLIGLLGAVVPSLQAISSMQYLWSTSHVIDGQPLGAVIPEFKATTIDKAFSTLIENIN